MFGSGGFQCGMYLLLILALNDCLLDVVTSECVVLIETPAVFAV